MTWQPQKYYALSLNVSSVIGPSPPSDRKSYGGDIWQCWQIWHFFHKTYGVHVVAILFSLLMLDANRTTQAHWKKKIVWKGIKVFISTVNCSDSYVYIFFFFSFAEMYLEACISNEPMLQQNLLQENKMF